MIVWMSASFESAAGPVIQAEYTAMNAADLLPT